MAKILKQVLMTDDIVYLGSGSSVIKEEPKETSYEGLVNDTYQKGYDDGLKEGETKAEVSYLPLKTQLEALLSSLPAALEAHRTEMHQSIVEYVLAIVSNLFIQHCAHPQFLETQVNQMIQHLHPQDVMELHLHPQDLAKLQDGTLQLNTNIPHGIAIKSDTTLALGGCSIKTKQGILNGSIEQQIDHLKKALLEIKQGGLHASAV